MRQVLMIRDQKRPKYIYRRFCNRCGELFKPTGKTQKICENCKVNNKGYKKINFN